MKTPFLILLSLLLTVPARADDQQTQLTTQFIGLPDIQTQIRATVLKSEPDPLRAQCNDLKVIDASRFTVVAPFEFANENGRLSPRTGGAIVSVKVDRCGKPAVRRVALFKSETDQTLSSRALTPGNFNGNIRLDVDTLKMFLPFASAQGKCSHEDVIRPIGADDVVKVTSQGGETLWTFSICNGKFIQFDVHYTPWIRDGQQVGMNMSAPQGKLLDHLP